MSVALAHTVDGPEEAPVVMLSNSLGTTWEMWDALLPALTAYRVVRMDTRGHGRSPVPPGPYAVDDLADDVLALADSLGIERFALVGLSLGGAVGQRLATSGRLTAAVLCCTVPRFGDPAGWHERAASVRASGMGVLAEPTRGRWFTDEFRAAHPEVVESFIETITSLSAEGYAACCEALATFDAHPWLADIDLPVRVVAGAEDEVATPDGCAALAAAIPGADLVVVPDASHLANVADPTAFNAAVLSHLEETL